MFALKGRESLRIARIGAVLGLSAQEQVPEDSPDDRAFDTIGSDMQRHHMVIAAICFLAPLCVAQQPAGPARGAGRGPVRPALFFREEWKPSKSGAEAAVNPAEAVVNSNLE